MRNIVNGADWVLRGRSGTAATLQTMLARLLIIAINLATGMITARALGPEGRGEQAAMLLWPQFLAFAMTLGLPAALVYNLKRHPEEESEFFSAALLLSTILGIVAALTGIIFIPQWLSQYSPEVIRIAQWFMLSAPIALLSLILVKAFEAQGDFTTANQSSYISPLISLVALSVFVLTHTLTPFTAALTYIVPGLPIAFWMLLRLWKRLHPRFRDFGSTSKRLISYGLRCYGIDLLSSLAGLGGNVLVVGLLPPTSMGLYVVALSISRMLDVLQTSIVAVLFPKTAARPVEEVIALTGRAARVSLALTFLAAIIVMILGPVLLTLLYGSEFLGAVPVFRILLIEVPLSGTTWILALAFMALGRPEMPTILQGVGLGLTVPLMLILIPAYGLLGAGLALLGSTTARLAFVLVSYKLVLKVRPPGLLIKWEDWNYIQQIFQLKNK